MSPNRNVKWQDTESNTPFVVISILFVLEVIYQLRPHDPENLFWISSLGEYEFPFVVAMILLILLDPP